MFPLVRPPWRFPVMLIPVFSSYCPWPELLLTSSRKCSELHANQMHQLPIPLIVRIRKWATFLGCTIYVPKRHLRLIIILWIYLPLCPVDFGVTYSFSLLLAFLITFSFNFVSAPRFIWKSISSSQKSLHFSFLYFYINWIMVREYAYKSSTFQKSLRFTLGPRT